MRTPSQLRRGTPPPCSPPASRSAAAAFQCKAEHLVAFTERDPFNPANTVSGVLCKDEGPLVGSVRTPLGPRRR